MRQESIATITAEGRETMPFDMSKRDLNNRPADSIALAARAAEMFYVKRLPKQEVAAALGISRFKAARLIDLAHEHGLVHIRIDVPSDRKPDLEQRLLEAFGLRYAVVTGVQGFSSLNAALGHAAASRLADILRQGDVLGIGWGSAVHATIAALTYERVRSPVDVVQLCGGIHDVDPALNAIELASTAAEKLRGALYPLHAPAFVDTPEARDALVRQASVSATFDMFSRVTVAIQGIGALRPMPDSAFFRGAGLSDQDMDRLRRLDAIGDTFGHPFDSAGSYIAEFASRAISIPPDRLLDVPVRVGIAGGARKVVAIRTALEATIVNELVTDSETAGEILAGAE